MEQAGPTHSGWLRNQEGHLGCRGSPWGTRVPAPHGILQPGTPELGKEVPITSGCKNRWSFCWMIWKASGVPGSSLEGPVPGRTNSTCFKLAGAAAWKVPGIYGVELNSLASGWGLGGTGVKAALSGEGSKCHCSLLQAGTESKLSINLVNTVCPTQHACPAGASNSKVLHTSNLSQLNTVDSPKISKVHRLLRRAVLASVYPVPLAKWPWALHRQWLVSTHIVTTIRWPSGGQEEQKWLWCLRIQLSALIMEEPGSSGRNVSTASRLQHSGTTCRGNQVAVDLRTWPPQTSHIPYHGGGFLIPRWPGHSRNMTSPVTQVMTAMITALSPARGASTACKRKKFML